MQYGFTAETTQTAVTVDNLNLFANDNIAEYWEKREERRHGGLAVDDQERDIVNFESIGKVSNSFASVIGVRNNNHFVAAIDQFLCSPIVSYILVRERRVLNTDC